jgi:hypothetical protein
MSVVNDVDRVAADLAVRRLIARYAQLVDDRQIRQCTDELLRAVRREITMG